MRLTKKLTLPKKALYVIEKIAHSSLEIDKISPEIQKLFDDIYTCSHVALSECRNEHKDWLKRLDYLYKCLEKSPSNIL